MFIKLFIKVKLMNKNKLVSALCVCTAELKQNRLIYEEIQLNLV